MTKDEILKKPVGGDVPKPEFAKPKPLNLPPQKVTTNTELFHALNPDMPKSQEQLAHEDKKRKRDELFAKIGDGVSAISNLFFTTQYAPDATPKQTASERVQLKWDKLRNEDDKKRANYYNQLVLARRADDEKAQKDREWKLQLQLHNHKMEMENAKANRDKELGNLNLLLAQGKIDEQQWKAEKARIEAGYADAINNSIVEKNKAQTNAANASASNSSASAERHRKEARGEFMVYDKDGNEHWFKDADAAENFARGQGTWVDEYGKKTTTTTPEFEGDSEKVVTTEEIIGGKSVKPNKKPNPMSSNTNKKPNPMQ
jgi:hypothetical protein